ncbi:MAG TPA: ABC transporter permease subunit [Roseiflexaceae bacterium]|nr:ABC transporter permease subunit [Roseiflexaceae bacterium]
MAKQATTTTVPAVIPHAPRRMHWTRRLLGRDWMVAYPFIAPMVLIMAGLIFWPFINAILISFTTRSIARTEQWVGLANYTRLLSDASYLGSLQNTIVFTAVSVACKLLVGLTIALLLHSRIPFRNILTGLMLLPWIVPEVVTAMAWRSIYDPIFGGLNPILQSLGIIDRRVAWLAENNLAMPSVIAVNIWKGIPFFTLLLLAGLKAIDRELYEAAEVDGARPIDKFRHITIPGLQYVMAVTLLLSTISTFNGFGLVYLMTGGGPGGATRLYSILAYEWAILGLRFGPGAAVALSTAPILVIFIALLARFMLRDQHAVRPDEGRLTRSLSTLGMLLSRLTDLLLWPISLVSDLFERIGHTLRRVFVGGRAHMRRATRERLGVGIRLLLILPFLLYVLFPFYWVFITAFKSELQIQQYTSIYWPEPWTIAQFEKLIYGTGYTAWFANTVFVAVVTTVLSVALAALAGYALARLNFRGNSALTTVLLVTYLLPGSLMFIPLYRILTTLGVINTHAALILTYPTFLMPFATWVMLGYYRSIPPDLEEAAMIDGATRLRSFLSVTLPLAKPALLAVTLFSFTNSWNEFLFAFVFLTSERLFTLPVGLQQLVFGDIYPWGQLMSASLIMSVPVVIAYIFAQKYMVEGLTAGSVKG